MNVMCNSWENKLLLLFDTVIVSDTVIVKIDCKIILLYNELEDYTYIIFNMRVQCMIVLVSIKCARRHIYKAKTHYQT